jgi:hypothetical protein
MPGANAVPRAAPIALGRRAASGLLVALVLAMCCAPADALEAPTGKVLLTVTGQIAERNSAEGAQFDAAMLEKLPQASFSTRTPWFPEPRKFTGVRLRDLLAALGAGHRTSVSAEAINDYRATIPAEDWTEHDLLVAWRLDDVPMAVRDMGPLLIIYPFDAEPRLRSAVRYSRAVWQLRRIDVR